MKPLSSTLLVLLGIVFLSVNVQTSRLREARAQSPASIRRVNVPYTEETKDDGLGVPTPLGAHAIFWFGKVTPTDNYVDVRMIYNDDALFVTLNIFDRSLWYDESPTLSELTSWDAVSLYLHTEANAPEVITPASYRFVTQLNGWEPQAGYQVAYQGNGSQWDNAATSFNTLTTWRGDGLNGPEARGWILAFEIPFQSIGVSGAPGNGVVWRLGLITHDRDDEAGTAILTNSWPETFDPTHPPSWGELHFGNPAYAPPPTVSHSETLIRHGVNNAIVPDAPAGGHSVCGEPFAPDFFQGWGDAVHQDAYVEEYGAPGSQINIQNQLDVADWPCFSKYYVTFPIQEVPPGKQIVSASLTLHQFGNARPSEALPSEIQVLTVAEEWNEGALTWNNGPLAVENIARSRIEPLREPVDWPGIPRSWDVSRAVADAYSASHPVRLVLYSADAPQHSGKYFFSSEAGEQNQVPRPTLTVIYGDSLEVSARSYLPLTRASR